MILEFEQVTNKWVFEYALYIDKKKSENELSCNQLPQYGLRK